tara:strand:+ start:1237 stop:1518 length:282 start_codon:yes stop_codon:yes gene_type:complete
MIPKNIFQSWWTKELHPDIQNKIDNMLKKNPDYKHKIYTDDEIDLFVNTYYPGKIADAYNKLNNNINFLIHFSQNSSFFLSPFLFKIDIDMVI